MSRFNTGNPIDSDDPRDRSDNTKNLDQALNNQNDTWTDRFGRERPTVAAAIDPTGLVQTAVDAKVAAEAARDGAFVNADVYATVAEGLAAVSTGEQFQTFFQGDLVRWEKISESPFYKEVARYSPAEKVNALDSAASRVGVMAAASPSDINFDTIGREINIADARVRILYGKAAALAAGSTVDMSALVDSYIYRLIFNFESGNFEVRRTTLPMQDGEVQVAVFKIADKRLYGVPYYTLNGAEPVSPDSDSVSVTSIDYIAAVGDFQPDYDQPSLPDYSSERSAAAADYENIYALYDALEASYPNYISSKTLGADALGNPIRQWDFKSRFPRDLTVGTRRPKILIVSGVHGTEQAGIWNVYFALREICERWRADKRLEALRWGVDFCVVPVAVPTGFNAFTRKNHNGVDIARNFPSGWSLGSDPDASTYGGAAPFDQAESVILDQFMQDNLDAVYFFSHHSFGGTPETQTFIWNASATEISMRLANRLIAIESIKSQSRYEYLPQSDDFFLGYTDLSAPGGSEGRHAAEAYQINAGTFEISMRWDYLEPRPSYSAEVATVGVETLINWLLINAKHGSDLVNTRATLALA